MLTNYRNIKNEIDHIKEQIETLESRRISPRTPILSGMPASPTFSNDKMDKDLIKLEELKEKYLGILERLCEEQLEVERQLEALEPIERDVLRCRYFLGMTWENIQKTLDLSQRTSFRIHTRALAKLNSFSVHN